MSLQVYRTRQAIARSANKWTLHQTIPRVAASSISAINPTWNPSSVIIPTQNFDIDANQSRPQIPRGALAFYREIFPPTECRAYRARLDDEGTERERAMLGAAGPEAVYIWDLDEVACSPEVILMTSEEDVNVSQI
jgi:hypothetical protein